MRPIVGSPPAWIGLIVAGGLAGYALRGLWGAAFGCWAMCFVLIVAMLKIASIEYEDDAKR